jgi:hypothetical protein
VKHLMSHMDLLGLEMLVWMYKFNVVNARLVFRESYTLFGDMFTNKSIKESESLLEEFDYYHRSCTE